MHLAFLICVAVISIHEVEPIDYKAGKLLDGKITIKECCDRIKSLDNMDK